jgi:carotenoid cleavage dioxygenase-like enzyme
VSFHSCTDNIVFPASTIALMPYADEKESRSSHPHPYLHGNFAPIHRVIPLTTCSYTGSIPEELAGGEYVRNGGNPVTNEELGRDAHWFDGDGMLSGVAFRRAENNRIQPEFVNQYILTDVYISALTTPSLRLPILPSIATLVNPASSLFTIILRIFRTIFLVLLSHLPGSEYAIKKISVANTGILYHDGRALATCESGPPMRVALPGLETVGWFGGQKTEGEPITEEVTGDKFGAGSRGLVGWMKEWTTAHPRIDPISNELILFHSTFVAPFVHYSIIPSTYNTNSVTPPPRLVSATIPGIKSAKMMHDFGVSLTHTVIMDLPLSLDPRNLARNEPVVSYDLFGHSRFGIFPRWQPDTVRWFETSPCCIFHTANTWDEISPTTSQTMAIHMLACRLTSASLVFSAGDVAAPIPKRATVEKEEEQCRLYYFRFDLDSPSTSNTITHQWALSAIPFEFPSIRDDVSMMNTKYVYGCSVSGSTFGAALGRAVKIDSLVKIDAHALIARGISNPPIPVTGCVDMRTVSEILASNDPYDPIQIFKLPPGIYAQEPRFVPRTNGISEDGGWVLSYVFDESQLDDYGNAPPSAKSELWIINARDMKTIVARVTLPQRVPYGLHGNWFSGDKIKNQRPIETIRRLPVAKAKAVDDLEVQEVTSVWLDIWMGVRKRLLDVVG